MAKKPQHVNLDDEEQQVMFPELDDSNPQHKTLMKLAKSFHRAKTERDEVLSTAKEKLDAMKEKLIAAMHEAGIKAFDHKGIKVEIISGVEKVQVKTDTDDDTEDE